MNPLSETIWWHVYPLGFLGEERTAAEVQGEVRHHLGGLEPWLDYAADLGCTGLALGPIFASETHGYDTTDHGRIDPPTTPTVTPLNALSPLFEVLKRPISRPRNCGGACS